MSETKKSCRGCAKFRRETESWEMPHIAWYECDVRPGIENLRNWPFKNTKCALFAPRPPAMSLAERLEDVRREQESFIEALREKQQREKENADA